MGARLHQMRFLTRLLSRVGFHIPYITGRTKILTREHLANGCGRGTLYSDWILWGWEDDALCYVIVVLISRSVALGKLSEFRPMYYIATITGYPFLLLLFFTHIYCVRGLCPMFHSYNVPGKSGVLRS